MILIENLLIRKCNAWLGLRKITNVITGCVLQLNQIMQRTMLKEASIIKYAVWMYIGLNSLDHQKNSIVYCICALSACTEVTRADFYLFRVTGED